MNRRHFLKAVTACSTSIMTSMAFGSVSARPVENYVFKAIPSSGEKIPAIGMGSFVNFNFVQDDDILKQRTELLGQFFELGGTLIDSSPMYGASEKNLGYCIDKLKARDKLFAASKVWTSSVDDGPSEIAASRQLWRINQFDLLQVHNLLSWEGHLEHLLDMKKQGGLRYVGVTTSHGRRHSELEQVMLNQPIDFVQATYNVIDREVEQRLLPIAREKGIAFISNRPFQRGVLIDWVKKHPLPEFARDLDCDNWASLLLKFIVSHPAVTCAIPATSRKDHLAENMQTMTGVLPDQKMRNQIVSHVASL